MVETRNKYVHGTAAEKLQYNVYEENKVLKAKKQHRSNNKLKLKMVLHVLVVFAACFAVIYRYALITDINYNMDRLNKQYNTLKNENLRLKVDIEKGTDLFKIREIAETKLGMQKPDKYQIVYVKVPKNDYTKVAEQFKQEHQDKDSVLATIADKFDELAQLLY